MPRYEYRCRACGSTFEMTRPMSESSAPCPCPDGHDDTVKLQQRGTSLPGCIRRQWWRKWRRLLWRGLRLRLRSGKRSQTPLPR
jgi:putative FmdB family regulatory protein